MSLLGMLPCGSRKVEGMTWECAYTEAAAISERNIDAKTGYHLNTGIGGFYSEHNFPTRGAHHELVRLRRQLRSVRTANEQFSGCCRE
jgi:hypothetical protein